MQISNKFIDSVTVKQGSQGYKPFGCRSGEVFGVYQRSQDKFGAIITFFWIFFEVFLLNVPIFGLFGSEEVEEADNFQVESLQPRESSKMRF